jgi:hypothetical protein
VRPGTLVKLQAPYGPAGVVTAFGSRGVVVYDGTHILTYEPERVEEIGWLRHEKTYTTGAGHRIARFIVRVAPYAERTFEVRVRDGRYGAEETRRQEMRMLLARQINREKRTSTGEAPSGRAQDKAETFGRGREAGMLEVVREIDRRIESEETRRTSGYRQRTAAMRSLKEWVEWTRAEKTGAGEAPSGRAG